MSDKTKRLRDNAIIKAQSDRLARKPAWAPPKCPCGNAAIIASHAGHDRVTLYCGGCAPADVLELFSTGPILN